MLGDQGLQVGDDGGVPPECQFGLHQVLEGAEPHLLATADHGGGELAVLELCERRAVHHRQRRPEPVGGSRRVVAEG